MIGRTLSHFKISAKLGEGGMGVVYRADDTKLGRKVAIKVLPEAFVADEERLARFEREAKVLASLEHPNIAGIYEVGQADGKHFLAMQLAPGEDLSQLLAAGKPDAEMSLSIALQIAAALEAAHARGVVHRDLKPANVKVASDGSGGVAVKVLDFGLAKAWDEGSGVEGSLSMSPTLTAQMTQAGVILGTAGYMSPEQARGQEADARADVWSFGVVLYEMLSGERLFSADTVSDTLARVLTFQPDQASGQADVPAPLRRLLDRCLEPDVSQRLQAIGEARIAIGRYLDDPEAEMVAAGTEGGSSEAASPSRFRRLAPIAVTALVAGLVATLITKEMAPEPPRSPVRRFEITVESAPGPRDRRPSISPDGRAVVFSLGQLMVRRLDHLELQPLEGTAGASFGVWSPDSQHILFQADDRSLYRVDLARGSKRLVAQVPATTFVMDAAWLGDDAVVFSIWRGDLYTASASGSPPQTLLELDHGTEVDVHRILALPDGSLMLEIHSETGPWPLEVLRNGERIKIKTGESKRPIAYDRNGDLIYQEDDDTLWAAPFDLESLEFTGDPLLVASGAAVPSMSSDGTLVYGVAFSELPGMVTRINRSGEVIESFGDSRVDLEDPTPSPDGKWVVAELETSGERSNNIWIFDLERSVWTRLTSDETDQGHPRWSGDGQRIFFRDGPNISTIRRDGVGGTQVLFPGRNPEAAPNADHLVFVKDMTAYYAPLDEDALLIGEPEQIPGTPAGNTGRAQLSPDGRWALYASDESGDYEVLVTEFPESRSRWQVSHDTAFDGIWSPDGSEIFYRSGNAVYQVDFDIVDGSPRLGNAVELFSGASFNGRLIMGFWPMGDAQSFMVVASAGDTGPASPRLIVVENALAEIER